MSFKRVVCFETFKVDVDLSGTVEFGEFCKLMAEQPELSPDQELLLAFKTFDKEFE